MMDGTSNIMGENGDEQVLEMPRERHSPNMLALLALALAMLAAACGSSGGPGSSGDAGTNDNAGASVGADQNRTAEVASGLDAISEAQGTPHILWFWGAN